MVAWIPRIARKVRRSRKAGAALVLGLLLVSILGNAATYYIFDGAQNPEITVADAIWYSIVSVTTIGYGDFYAVTLGARVGLVFFVVIMGLATFSAFLGLVVDAIMSIQYRELHGLSKPYAKDHIIICHFPDESRVYKIITELREDPEYAGTDVVLVDNNLEKIPFVLPEVSFVKGSPMQIETLERAGLKDAQMVIVLCTSQNDPGSDGAVASVINLVEHLRPEIKTIAECLDDRHRVLFHSTKCDSVVYSNQLINNLLVQETQDHGVSSLVSELTDNGQGHTMYSAQVTANFGQSYQEIVKKSTALYFLSVERGGTHHIDWRELKAEENDRVIYVAPERKSWSQLVSG